ncbi:MAG: arylsulfatase [bacterium]|nr:arylsulfatase [bacterium]
MVQERQSRRAFLSMAAAAALGGCATREAVSARGGLHGSRPNIVFILSDDLSYFDLSFLGQTHYTTPNIDRLAEEGVVFTNAYAGAPECAPSRASLMTGMHMGHCRVRANRSARGQDHLCSEDLTVAEVLKEAGYATGFAGKWGVGLPGSPGTPDKKGFDYSFGYYDQGRAHTFYPHYLIENGREVPLPGNYGFNMDRVYTYNRRPVENLDDVANRYDEAGRLVADGVADPAAVVYSEDLILDKALGFIRYHSDEPFFLYYATQLPHGPCIVPELGRFKDKPWDLKHREWAAMVERLDRSVGSLVEELKGQGVYDNTVIFFAGDNGYSQYGYFGRKAWEDDPLFRNKGPWHKGKFVCTDGGGRVPFVVSSPGCIRPGTTDRLTPLYDFLATAAGLAGVTPREKTDGLSLVPLLEGRHERQCAHASIYWENGTKSPHAQAVRMGPWFAYREHPDKPVQLYDVEIDVSCATDVAGEHPVIVKRALAVFEECHVDSEWYTNPGDAPAVVKARKARAEAEGTLQTPTRPNTRCPDGEGR